MRVLLLGGTQFIGRHVVPKLLALGHDVTLLNRGQTAPGLYADLQQIHADRETPEFLKLKELKQPWDAVIDLSSYYPRTLAPFLDLIRGRTGRYVYCSTISSYAALSLDGSKPLPTLSEDLPLLECTDNEAIDTSWATYGKRKAKCERIVRRAQGLSSVILRPSVVFGEWDYTDRLAYWIWRASGNKPFILPDGGEHTTARTYAPDLASAFALALTSPKAPGNAYNIAEREQLSLKEILGTLGSHLGSKPLEHAVSFSGDSLLEKGLKPWSDLPLWIPAKDLRVDVSKATADLGYASTDAKSALTQTADAFLKLKRPPSAGMSQDQESRILRSNTR